MRIALVAEHASPLAASGGQSVHVAQLASALSRRGHEVRVYTRWDNRRLPEAFGHWMSRRWDTGDFAPDVVHAHFWMSGVAALTAAQVRRRPMVVTYHSLGTVERRMRGDQDTSPPGRIDVERAIGRLADRVVVQSRDEIEELRAYSVDLAKMTLIPSGVDIRRLGPARDPHRPATRTVLTVTRFVEPFVERQGHTDIIRALPDLPGVELLIAGGPPRAELDADPFAARLRSLADQLGVADRLRLLGRVPQDQMAALYRSVDLLACTPWYEPFGITPLEAMACGTPVVAYAVGGLRDTVRHRKTGTLIPPRDIGALSAAIAELAGDDRRRWAYGQAAVEIARKQYDWDVLAGRMEGAYRAAMNAATKAAVGVYG